MARFKFNWMAKQTLEVKIAEREAEISMLKAEVAIAQAERAMWRARAICANPGDGVVILSAPSERVN